MHMISQRTMLIVILFALSYLFLLLKKTARQQLDIYDLIMLSTVSFIPMLFVLFPSFADWVAYFTGVAFPFVIMFGLLFAILFIFIHRLTLKLHRLELDNRLLIQEVSLLRQKNKSTMAGKLNE